MPVWPETIEAELTAPGIIVRVIAIDEIGPTDYERRFSRNGLALLLSQPTAFSKGSCRTGEISGSYVDTGNVVFAPAGAYLQGRTSGSAFRHVACNFDADRFEKLTGLGQKWNSIALTECLNVKNVRLAQTLARLAQEAMAPGFASSRMTECLALLAAVELARHFDDLKSRSETAAQTLLPWQMQRVADHIHNLARYTPDIDEIAGLCGIGSRHLRRLFKQTTDRTIYEYAKDIWAGKAKKLLSETDLPIKEIALQLGFFDASSFSTAFHRTTGDTPKSFRQQCRRSA